MNCSNFLLFWLLGKPLKHKLRNFFYQQIIVVVHLQGAVNFLASQMKQLCASNRNTLFSATSCQKHLI